MEELPINLELKSKGGLYTASKPDGEDKYPSLHYTGPDELDLPETGEMTVRFRVKREVSEVNSQGVHHYNCDIEVSEILKVKGDDDFTPPAKSGNEAEDALDRLRDEMEAGAEKEPNSKY